MPRSSYLCWTQGLLALVTSLTLIAPARAQQPAPSKQNPAKPAAATDAATATATAALAKLAAEGEAAPAPTDAAQLSFDQNWWHPPGDPRELAGVQNCYLCHTKTDVNKSLPPGIIPPGGADDGWVLLNELQTWAEKDKHYQAYAVLFNERSQQMAKTLNVVDDKGQSLIHRDKRCLSCHSSIPIDQLMTDGHGLISDQLAQDPRINLGVSCEGCHGASLGTANSKGWNDIHRTKNQWRFLSPAEKFDTYGFWDVRTPVNKARICASCHIGNVEQGKVLTHEMYAAGHPPLPGFELATFIEQEPQHWRDFGAKKPEIRAEFLEKTKSQYDEKALHHSQTMLIGALISMSESLKLTADLIDEQVESPIEKPTWPELANFACFACHHDLASKAWRQQRVYTLPPGRPFLHEWPQPLAMVALERTKDGPAELKEQLAAVRKTLGAQPFGVAGDLQQATRSTAEFLFNTAVKLQDQPLSREEGQKLLEQLVALGATQILDYDSARQLVWGAHVLYSELKGTTAQRVPGQLTGWYTNRKDLDEVEQILAGLGGTVSQNGEPGMFILDLREGRQTQQALLGQTRPQTEVELQKSLPPVSNYAPDKFRAAFQKLQKALQKAR